MKKYFGNRCRHNGQRYSTCFAQAGFNVTLYDINATQLEKALATIGKNFDRQVAKGTVTEEQKLNALANIFTNTNIADGVKMPGLL